VNALRAVAALSVVVYHVLLQLRQHQALATGLRPLDNLLVRSIDRLGGWGVSVFLVLSGYGLVRSFSRSASIRVFWKKRAGRIYPVFWWVAVPTVIVAAAVGALAASQYWKLPFWLLGLNFLSPSLFRPLPGVAPQWWYVGLALQVYAVFPLLAIVLRRYGPIVLLVCCLAVNALSVAAIAALPHAWAYLDLGFVGARSLELASGMALATVLSSPRRGSRSAAVAVVMVACFALMAVVQPGEMIHWLFELTVIAFVACALVVPSLGSATAPRMRLVVDRAGAISYTLYLCHYAVIAVCLGALQEVEVLTPLALLLVSVPASILVAQAFAASYDLVRERRAAIRVRRRLS
jgi:peptidoglycan/LPS O-acetylase OafA/YrhL